MQKLLQKLDRLLVYLVATILLAIPLFPKFPFIEVPGTFVSIRLEDFLLFASAAVWLAVNYKKLGKYLANPVVFAMAVYVFVSLVSVLSAVFLTKMVPIHIGLLHLVRRVEYFVAFVLGLSVIKNKQNFNFYTKLLIIVALWALIYGLGQKYFSWPIVTTQNAEYSKGVALRYLPGGHIPATFAGHYDLATYLVLTTPILFAMFFTVKNKGLKIGYGLAIAASYWLMINAVSRISIVSFMGAIVLALFLIKKYKAIPAVLILSFLVMLTSNSLRVRYMRIFDYLFGQVVTTVHAAELSVGSVLGQEDRSTSIRLNVEWPRAVRALTKNPLLGTGFSSITLATDNDYLRALGETGILGFTAFMLVLVNLGVVFLKSKKTPYIAGIFAGFLGILVNALFIDIFEASKFAILFWLLTGIGYASTQISKKTA